MLTIRFILILWICALSRISCLTEEMQELADMLHKTCVDETGVPEGMLLLNLKHLLERDFADLIENARKGDFANDERLKCYMKCLMVEMACVDEEGIIDIDGTIAVLPEEYKDVAEPIIRKCGTKIGANACENVWLTNKCYYENSPKDYFLI